VSLVTKKDRALVLETGLLNALFYGGLFGALQEAGQSFDLLYTSSYGYIVAVLSLLSGSEGEFKKRMDHFFSEDRMSKLLDVTFPTDHVFKNDSVLKLAGEVCGSARVETFHELPVAMLGQNGTSGRRLFSTGYLRDILAASFCLYPVFEEVPILDGRYNAGYPGYRVRAEDLFRIDVDETVCVSVQNGMKPAYRDGKLMSFFTRYLDFVGEYVADGTTSDLSDESIMIEVSEKDVRPGKIMDISREISDKVVKKLARRP
jgi:predicted acylesterase/phospholipase RssA